MIAVGGLGKVYDAWKDSDPLPQTEARRECLSRLKDMGVRGNDRVEICNCALRKARAWKSDNPDAEYTLAVHRSVVGPCVTEAFAKADNGTSQPGVFTSGPSPKRRSFSGSYGPDEPTSEELGWGTK
jgi:hypothetical protein